MEIEYNRRVHREIGCAPVTRFAAAPDVLRPSPSSDALRRRFAGTCSGVSAKATARSRWTACGSRSRAAIVTSGTWWCVIRVGTWAWWIWWTRGRARSWPVSFRLDRAANADGRRALLDPQPEQISASEPRESSAELPPLLRQILAEYSATGLPPAYLPKNAAPKQAEEGGAA